MTEQAPITVAEVLWDSAERYAERPCVADLDGPAGTALSYCEVARRAAAVAGALLEHGLSPGDRVALLLPNSLAYVDAYLGASAAGLVVVPLNVRLAREDYLHMLADSQSRILITTGEFLAQVPELAGIPGVAVVRADSTDGAQSELDRMAEHAIPVVTPSPRAESDVASLMYTSGTTGTPKAVMLSNRSWASVAATAIDVLDMGPDEVTLHVAPLTHGAGFLLLPTLMLGGLNLLCPSFNAGRSLEILRERQVTGLFVVPSMIRMMLDAGGDGWSAPETLRRLYYAGSPIDPETMREATRAFGGRLIQSFAQMESPMFFTSLRQDDHLRTLRDGAHLVRSAGRVLDGVELRIVAEDGTRLAAGLPGEIVARAPQTMLGYWGRPEDSAATVVDGWLHTGDIGYLDEEGYLFIVDRKKDMIVTGGSNVYAREVEEVLLGLPGVKEAAVVGTPHRIWGEAVTAVLVSSDERRDSEAVIAGCKAVLAGYRVPKEVVWIDELPRNAYGKVLKRQLRDSIVAPVAQ
jgi:acyl-CoA synthetase (AMP-forming)/AMP-acid ligase II